MIFFLLFFSLFPGHFIYGNFISPINNFELVISGLLPEQGSDRFSINPCPFRLSSNFSVYNTSILYTQGSFNNNFGCIRMDGKCITKNTIMRYDKFCDHSLISLEGFQILKMIKTGLVAEIFHQTFSLSVASGDFKQNITVRLIIDTLSRKSDWIPFLGNIAGAVYRKTLCPEDTFVTSISMSDTFEYGTELYGSFQFICGNDNDTIIYGSNGIMGELARNIWSSHDWADYPVSGLSVNSKDSPGILGFLFFSGINGVEVGSWFGQGIDSAPTISCPAGEAANGFHIYSIKQSVNAIALSCSPISTEIQCPSSVHLIAPNSSIPAFLSVKNQIGDLNDWSVCISLPPTMTIIDTSFGFNVIPVGGCMSYYSILKGKVSILVNNEESTIISNITVTNKMGISLQKRHIQFLIRSAAQTVLLGREITSQTIAITIATFMTIIGSSITAYTFYFKNWLQSRKIERALSKSSKTVGSIPLQVMTVPEAASKRPSDLESKRKQPTLEPSIPTSLELKPKSGNSVNLDSRKKFKVKLPPINFEDRPDYLRDTSSSNSKTAKTISKTISIKDNSFLSVPGYLKLNLKNDFEVIGNLDKGGTALLQSAKIINPQLIEKHNFKEAALKIMLDNLGKESNDLFRFEVALLGSIPPSPFLVHFMGYFEEPAGIAMKLYQGSLADWIKKPIVTSKQIQTLHFALDIAMGCNHLHDNRIVHFDLKPGNVLVEHLNDKTVRGVITDFGYAKPIGTDFQSPMDRVVKGLKVPTQGGATIAYLAPEMIKNARQKRLQCVEKHKKVDVYAYSLVLLQLVSREPLWKGLSTEEIKIKVLGGNRPELPESMKSTNDPIMLAIKELIQSCWDQDPDKRPSLLDIIEAFSEIQ